MEGGNVLSFSETQGTYAVDGSARRAGGNEQEFPVAGNTGEADVDLLGLPVHFQQPSTSQHFKPPKSRPKGRKAEKPVKLSQRRSNTGEEEGRDRQDQGAVTGNQAAGLSAANGDQSNPVIKKIKWDISRDLSKEQRKQNASGEAESVDDNPSQSPFNCITCQQVFYQASDYMTHVCSQGINPPDPEDDSTADTKVRQNGKQKEGGRSRGRSSKLDEKIQRYVGDKLVLHCPDCEAVFTDQFQYSLHREEGHAEEDPSQRYECQSCGKTFLGKRVLNQHYRRSHPEARFYACPVCDQTFPTASSLTLHKRNHVGHRPFKCGEDGCDRAFPDMASMNRHRRTHSQERPHVCQHCGKAFKMQNHLREHTRLHTGEKPFVCEVCGAGFAQSNGLKSHARQHSLDQGNQCSICHKVFSHPQFLELHKKNHSDEKPFSCELCGQMFRTTTNLGAHKRLKHDMISRKGENVFSCDVCGSTFAQACNLSVHKKIHGGEKPFQCDLCDQTFRTPANLGAHRKLKHEMDRDRAGKHFTCDICGATFSQACNLGIHKKKKHIDLPVSSLERKYVCDICDARFSEPCNLGAHKKIKHAEESDDGRVVFDCDICGAKFYRACNLSGHKRRKHGDSGDMKEADKPFMCQFCNVRCTTLENLREHKSKIHCSMTPYFAEAQSAFDTAKAHVGLSSDSQAFDSRQQPEPPQPSTLGSHHTKFSQSFSESDHRPAFPSPVPPSMNPGKPPPLEYVNHRETDPVSSKAENPHSSTGVGVFPTQAGNSRHKPSYSQPPSIYDSRLPVDAATNLHAFPMPVRPSACHVCGALMPDERSLLQHLELHASDRYLHDVFSAQ